MGPAPGAEETAEGKTENPEHNLTLPERPVPRRDGPSAWGEYGRPLPSLTGPALALLVICWVRLGRFLRLEVPVF